jgi:hypothetical protein
LHPDIVEKPVVIGEPLFTRNELGESLEEFAELYEQRPIKDNQGGMEAPQMFGAWMTAKKLQPVNIIESGVWYGQGTWFFEKACPGANLFCIEPNLERIKYKGENAVYTTHDFQKINWEMSLEDRDRTLCFFDDHQNAAERVPFAHTHGFRHLMFEDNYPVTQGDCVSLKSELEQNTRTARRLTHFYLDTYYEFPPVVKGVKTRWGDDWTNEVYPTHDPLLAPFIMRLKDSSGKVIRGTMDIFYEGYENYTWICYVRLKDERPNSFSE